MNVIPENKHDLTQIKGYFSRFFNLLPYFKNGEEAYNYLENEYFTKYRQYKYKSYNSFKASKSKFFGLY
jgi:hypothetical protein